ncbi:MAG TPA: hypothetical protein VK034_22335 [Enhygromyxa sp.]|nr:hypothetical protein [Enhygromyxa sp.]
MQFLLDKLNKHQVDPDGVEIYTNLAGEQVVIVDRNLNRAVLRMAGREVTLIRNNDGHWVPRDNDWAALAEVLGAPGLAVARLGF